MIIMSKDKWMLEKLTVKEKSDLLDCLFSEDEDADIELTTLTEYVLKSLHKRNAEFWEEMQL